MTAWQNRLGNFFEQTEKKSADKKESGMAQFVVSVVVPAFDQIRDEMEKHGREVNVRNAEVSVVIMIYRNGEEEMTYRVQGRTFPNGVVPYAEVRTRQRNGLKIVRVESMFRSGTPNYTLADVTSDEIIQNFISHYTSRVPRD